LETPLFSIATNAWQLCKPVPREATDTHWPTPVVTATIRGMLRSRKRVRDTLRPWATVKQKMAAADSQKLTNHRISHAVFNGLHFSRAPHD
jgi:hypothetical protein